jgi:UDP-glucuronate 4-epimerase
MKILITGAAGFIGFHSSLRLLAAGHEIIGIDNINDYYEVRLKESRLQLLNKLPNFCFKKIDLASRKEVADLFLSNSFDIVLHLGAQAGVRYSIQNPFAYIDSNIVGMLTILEGCRNSQIDHLIYASSSSVYGANIKSPFSIEDKVDSPISLYAATKKADELLAYSYSSLYKIAITGLRFFTVYGPWGRPDMAYFKFAKAILQDKPIDVYNNGDMKRDFTYIDDVVDCIERIIEISPKTPGHRIYNVGHNEPELLGNLIKLIEENLGKEARKNYLPMQPGDVYSTYADISETTRDYGFSPKVSLQVGIEKFIIWLKENLSFAMN